MEKKAYKYRFYPDNEQIELLAKTFGCVRYVYNDILKYRTDAYYAAKESVSYIGANARLTAIKKNPEL
jgi:putative transposase